MQVLQRELKGLPYIIALFFECAPTPFECCLRPTSPPQKAGRVLMRASLVRAALPPSTRTPLAPFGLMRRQTSFHNPSL